jgi:serine/threonine-protein kinase
VTTLKRGEKFADRYVIVEPVGEGGMGVVYSARDEKLGRTVAVKMLSPQRAGSKTARARLKREARAAAALDNPGIAQVFDVGETPDGGVYLVMELVRGKSVRGLKAPSLDRAEALRIVGEVARTLGAAHRAELIHRDVKPDNIMIRDDGRVVLLDFGIAKDVKTAPRKSSDEGDDSVVTAQGALLGTPPYVAPEQIRGKDVSPASDQFALGVVAFGLLTGKRPWDAPTELGLLGQILMEPALAATAAMPALPPAVDAVFDQVLAKEAQKRFPTVEAFADALEGAVTGKAIVPSAPPEAPAKKAPADEPAEDMEASLEKPEAPAPPPPEPVVFAPPVWKIRVNDEPPPRATGRMVLAAIVIAVLAAAAGVWYGRNNAPPPSSTGSGDTGQGR